MSIFSVDDISFLWFLFSVVAPKINRKDTASSASVKKPSVQRVAAKPSSTLSPSVKPGKMTVCRLMDGFDV